MRVLSTMGEKSDVLLKGGFGMLVRSNPGDERINILYKLPRVLTDGHISIYDQKGKLVKDIDIRGMNGLISVNIWELGGYGAYNCILTENGSVRYHDKVEAAYA